MDTFLHKIDNYYNLIMSSEESDILNEDFLTELIGSIGLYHDLRFHPKDPTIHMYGNDVKYMNSYDSYIENIGMWQIPRQLAGFLIKLVSLGKVETYLDIGTFSGATITVVSIYLMRFGLKRVDTLDIIKYVKDELIQKWDELKLPINYKIINNNLFSKTDAPLNKYDVIFIDANHAYDYIKNDYDQVNDMSKIICFHDIDDVWCLDVVKFWNEIKQDKIYHEFKYHSHYNLMGIGILQLQ
jgi:hypothetical protein